MSQHLEKKKKKLFLRFFLSSNFLRLEDHHHQSIDSFIDFEQIDTDLEVFHMSTGWHIENATLFSQAF